MIANERSGDAVAVFRNGCVDLPNRESRTGKDAKEKIIIVMIKYKRKGALNVAYACIRQLILPAHYLKLFSDI
jgi:hypothetical protein